jgi:hypothetical protein
VRRLLPLGCGLLLAVAGPVSGFAGASGSPHSAGQLLSDALTAAGQAESVHIVDKTTAGKVSEELVGSLSAPTAGESLSGPGAQPLEVELVKGAVYVSGSSAALESALSLTGSQAAAVANKWVVVQSSDAPFQGLTQTLTVSGEIDTFAPNRSTAQLGKRTKVDGVSVYPIYGRPAAALPKGSSASVALFVPVKAPHRPVGATLVIGSTSTSTRLHEVAAFTNWNKPVNLTAPTTNTVAYSTLTG